MRINVDFDTIKARHPDEVEHIINALRESTSKERNSAPEALTWGYDWCVAIQGKTFFEMINSLPSLNAKERPPKKSIDERVEAKIQEIKGKISFCVIASKGRWSKCSESFCEGGGLAYDVFVPKDDKLTKVPVKVTARGLTIVPTIPPEIISFYQESYRESEIEADRFDSLSVSEQNAETAENIAQLKKMGGFSGFYVNTKTT